MDLTNVASVNPHGRHHISITEVEVVVHRMQREETILAAELTLNFRMVGRIWKEHFWTSEI